MTEEFSSGMPLQTPAVVDLDLVLTALQDQSDELHRTCAALLDQAASHERRIEAQRRRIEALERQLGGASPGGHVTSGEQD